ncbi:uncharacterized protein DUF397 [Murinocardiopsis flavida]|uniref:Uncharacterized protein DUF397 n=1 Tax=Murinocardiopsis flavida TaxID=645275 RepID=A0A2P8CWP4_9ACTN|nr:DUF397 domain-containing protein [Murinocardiopsis flavida]PSK89404.1 uncharacterized protein DUF397 [Murinocardiopsis flavida]
MHLSIEDFDRPFRTSSYSSAADNCVEMADGRRGVAIRDTKNRELGALFFGAGEWRAFIDAARNNGL